MIHNDIIPEKRPGSKGMTVNGQACLGHLALLPSAKRVVRMRSLLQVASDSTPVRQEQGQFARLPPPRDFFVGQHHKITNVEGKDEAFLSRGGQQLGFIARVGRYPVVGRPSHVVTTFISARWAS